MADKQGTRLKMHEMAILETQIFKRFWGTMPPDPPRKLAPSALAVPLLFQNPGSATAQISKMTIRKSSNETVGSSSNRITQMVRAL